MRQAGIVAAAGVYALDHHVERLADDHARAKRLALGLAEAGLAVDPDGVETNFVQIDVAPLSKEEAIGAARRAGRRPVGHDPSDRAARRHAPRRHRRGHRRARSMRSRGRSGARVSA